MENFFKILAIVLIVVLGLISIMVGGILLGGVINTAFAGEPVVWSTDHDKPTPVTVPVKHCGEFEQWDVRVADVDLSFIRIGDEHSLLVAVSNRADHVSVAVHRVAPNERPKVLDFVLSPVGAAHGKADQAERIDPRLLVGRGWGVRSEYIVYVYSATEPLRYGARKLGRSLWEAGRGILRENGEKAEEPKEVKARYIAVAKVTLGWK